MSSWARYKVLIGHTIWDNDCGVLPDLEDTLSWSHAATWCLMAEAMVEMTDRHAYHGTIVAWCGWDRPVLLRQLSSR